MPPLPPPTIAAANQELSHAIPREPVFVDGDPVRLSQIFGNLLNNASKFTESGGRIRLTAECDGNEVVVSVIDTGVGIAPEMLPRVFEMFTQADRTIERAKGGLGIGLTLARRLTEMHGGSLTAASEGDGKGSIFAVRLPLAVAGRPEEMRTEEWPAPAAPEATLIPGDGAPRGRQPAIEDAR